jgi:hypothetical protein
MRVDRCLASHSLQEARCCVFIGPRYRAIASIIGAVWSANGVPGFAIVRSPAPIGRLAVRVSRPILVPLLERLVSGVSERYQPPPP